jgi:hypothetical protein
METFFSWSLLDNIPFYFFHAYNILSYIQGCDYRRGTLWWIGFIDHLYTPLQTTLSRTTLCRSLTNTCYCPRPITVSTSRFLATASTEGDSLASCIQILLSQPPVKSCYQLTTQLTALPRLVAISHQLPSLLFTGWLSTDCLSTEPSHSPTSYFTSLHSTELPTSPTPEQSHSPSQNYFTAGGLPPISSSWRQAPGDSRSEIFISTEPLRP